MRERKEKSEAAWRRRSAAVMSDFQMERIARETEKGSGSHLCLAEFPDLWDIVPWVRNVA